MRTALLAFLLLAQDKGEIRLLVRADDMGVALGVNEACIRSVKEGIARSVEVIVPGPWFLDAVRRLQEIERELRAQIELLKRHVPRLSHASAHMGAATATPEARAITEKLCREF